MTTPRKNTQAEESSTLYDSIYKLLVVGDPRTLFESRIDEIVRTHQYFHHDAEVKETKHEKKLEVGAGSFHADSYNHEMRSLLQLTKPLTTTTQDAARNTARQFLLGNAVFELYQLINQVISREEKPDSKEYKDAVTQAKKKAASIIEDRHHRKAVFMANYERELNSGIPVVIIDEAETKRLQANSRRVTYFKKDEKNHKITTRVEVTEKEQIELDAEFARELSNTINRRR